MLEGWPPPVFDPAGPAPAWSLAVSDVVLQSHLNQPLDARVRLLSASQEELDSLVVTVTGTDTDHRHFYFRSDLAGQMSRYFFQYDGEATGFGQQMSVFQ